MMVAEKKIPCDFERSIWMALIGTLLRKGEGSLQDAQPWN